MDSAEFAGETFIIVGGQLALEMSLVQEYLES